MQHREAGAKQFPREQVVPSDVVASSSGFVRGVSGSLEPTEDQRAVIERAPDMRVFVVAGPGAGKTWTLLQRAGKLTAEDGLEAADLLVLSFTRAVVAELRKRDRTLADRSHIRPETFDSFATRLLAEHAEDDAWRSTGFDGRIAAATRLLESGAADATIERVQHLLLDEVQDLVGVRSGFVSALLRTHRGGFTAFGDPAQAIYDHERGRDDEGFLEAIQKQFADETLEIRGNKRASGQLAALATELRSVILERNGDGAADAVHRAFDELVTLGESSALGPQLLRARRAAAVLCRDNATALSLSEAFHRDGVAHHLRRGTTDRPVAPWVAAVFAGRTSLARTALENRHAELSAAGFPGLPEADVAWSVLSRLDRSARGGAVREREVRSRIAVGAVPWELYEEPPAELVISSIHRAKGLEFDECIIVEWSPREEQNDALEARVLFVALTRARDECWHAEENRRRRWFRNPEAHDRFIKHGGERWQTFGLEIRGDDVHAYDPGGELAIDRSATEIQDLLTERVRPGDDIELRYLCEHDYGRGKRPMYAVMHAEHGAIGVSGAQLGDALRGRLRDRGRPARICSLRVDDLETVAGSPDIGEAAGLGRTGLWLRPRLMGLGDFQWKT